MGMRIPIFLVGLVTVDPLNHSSVPLVVHMGELLRKPGVHLIRRKSDQLSHDVGLDMPTDAS